MRQLKARFYRAQQEPKASARDAERAGHANHQINRHPDRMLHIPKNRNCPSFRSNIWVNMRRQPEGESIGNRPSNTSTRPSASQKTSSPKVYFVGFGEAGKAPTAPRKTLKNSEDAGSTTMTSLFLPKLAL